MVILVCGGRHYSNFHRLCEELDYWLQKADTLEVITGGARGADTLAERWCALMGVAYRAFPANWDEHGRRAGPIRNSKMLDEKPDLVIACPGGRGTADMVVKATRRGVKVTELEE